MVAEVTEKTFLFFFCVCKCLHMCSNVFEFTAGRCPGASLQPPSFQVRNPVLWSGLGLVEALWAALCSPVFLTGYISYCFCLCLSIPAAGTVICSWIGLCMCIWSSGVLKLP